MVVKNKIHLQKTFEGCFRIDDILLVQELEKQLQVKVIKYFKNYQTIFFQLLLDLVH